VCRFGGGLKAAFLKKSACGASLKARELMRAKKVDMGKNVQPKHFPNR